MGVEYELRLPEPARAAVAEALGRELSPLLARVDPRASESFPHAYVNVVPEGLYVCDNQTDELVSSQIIRALVDLLLRYSPSVEVVQP